MAIPDLLDTWNRLTDATLYGNPGGTGGVPATRQINTTAPLTGGGDLSADRTLAITLTGGGSGAVGTGRTIATTAPLTGGGDLSADRTLALTTSPAGQTPVGVTRLITTTAPLKIDGGASANLSADRTLSIIPFTGSVDGIVTHNPSGVQGKFLKDDNTWGTSAVAGVSDVTGTAPIVASPTTGSVVVSVNQFGTLTGGIVPPTGGVGSNYFACADNTWKVPGTGGFVSLQGGTPGTADTGNAHVTGTIIANTRLAAGYATPVNIATVEAYTQTALDGFLGRAAGTSGSARMYQQRSRGTLASPTATQDVDTLGQFVATGYSTTGGWNGNLEAGMVIRADGNAASTRQPSLTDIIGGDVGNFTLARMTGVGMRLESALGSISNTVRANSTLDVEGSFALRVQTFAGATTVFNVGATSCLHLADCTTAAKAFILPTAVGATGRLYGFTKVDSGPNPTSVSGTGGQKISTIDTVSMINQGESVWLYSDNANWWLLNDSRKAERGSKSSDTTVANTITETSIGGVWNDVYPQVGFSAWQFYAGKFSTTGTPTLRFRVAEPGGNKFADSGTLTMPNNAANYPFMVRTRVVVNAVSPSFVGTGRVVEAVVYIGSSTGAFTPYSMFSSFGDQNVGYFGSTYALYVTWGTASSSNTITCTAAEGGAVAVTKVV